MILNRRLNDGKRARRCTASMRFRRRFPVATNYLLGAALATMVACSTTSQLEPQPEPQPEPQRAAIRPFIQSSDLDASLAFYRDLLGFKVLLIADYDNDRLREFANIDPEVMPKVALLSDDGATLAFSVFTAAGLEVDRDANRRYAPTFILDRSDLHALHQQAVQAGIEIVFAPEDTLDQDQQLHSRELGMIGPDGLRILLIEKFSSLSDQN